ncbi:unnamed protein product [Rhizophagus irregularis]|nr:unnamed protein product [Rhizophagus irregularis]
MHYPKININIKEEHDGAELLPFSTNTYISSSSYSVLLGCNSWANNLKTRFDEHVVINCESGKESSRVPIIMDTFQQPFSVEV